MPSQADNGAMIEASATGLKLECILLLAMDDDLQDAVDEVRKITVDRTQRSKQTFSLGVDGDCFLVIVFHHFLIAHAAVATLR
jgi:hypothetical protein